MFYNIAHPYNQHYEIYTRSTGCGHASHLLLHRSVFTLANTKKLAGNTIAKIHCSCYCRDKTQHLFLIPLTPQSHYYSGTQLSIRTHKDLGNHPSREQCPA